MIIALNNKSNLGKTEFGLYQEKLNTINTNLASLDRLQKDGLYEQWHDVFGFKFENISYQLV